MKECDESVYGKRNLTKVEAFKPQAYYIIKTLETVLCDDYKIIVDDLKRRVDAISVVDEKVMSEFYQLLTVLSDNHRLIAYSISLARSNFITVLTLPVDDFSSSLTPVE